MKSVFHQQGFYGCAFDAQPNMIYESAKTVVHYLLSFEM